MRRAMPIVEYICDICKLPGMGHPKRKRHPGKCSREYIRRWQKASNYNKQRRDQRAQRPDRPISVGGGCCAIPPTSKQRKRFKFWRRRVCTGSDILRARGPKLERLLVEVMSGEVKLMKSSQEKAPTCAGA